MLAPGTAFFEFATISSNAAPTALVAQVELHAADIALVGDIRRNDLEDDRIPRGFGLGLGFGAGGGECGGGDGDAGVLEKRFGLDLIEQGPAFGAGLRQDCFE
jgi:hypothetical protein